MFRVTPPEGKAHLEIIWPSYLGSQTSLLLVETVSMNFQR